MLRKPLIAILILLFGCSAEKEVERPDGTPEPSATYDAMRRTAAEFTCEKKTFLEHAQLDSAECGGALEAYAPLCWKVVEPLYPNDEFVRSPEEWDANAVDLAKLFVYCAQAHILLDKAIPEMIEEELSD